MPWEPIPEPEAATEDYQESSQTTTKHVVVFAPLLTISVKGNRDEVHESQVHHWTKTCNGRPNKGYQR